MADLTIRKMAIDDIKDVMEVDKVSFQKPWTEDIFQLEIDKNDHAHYFVLTLEQKIIGYAGMWVVIDDAQITNIAILLEFRGYKFSEMLFRFICKLVFVMGVKRLSLEVRASNIIAQKMYRKFGMVPGGVRKNYYTDNCEDAIVMWVNLQ